MQTALPGKRFALRRLLAAWCLVTGGLVLHAPVLAQGAVPVAKAAAVSGPAGKTNLLRPGKKAAPANAKADQVADHPSSGNPRIVSFRNSAFPYDGLIPVEKKAFLDVVETSGRRGHTSPRGGISWEDTTFSDRRTLLYVPKNFDIQRPGVIIVFFHGNQAILGRDVMGRQAVPQQVAESGLNAVLVAPQLAVNALDSSAGHFWDDGFFARFLDEAATKLGEIQGAGSTEKFRAMPVVVVAYSGGYLPAIFALEVGGTGGRVHGVILLDALFGEVERYARWIGQHGAQTFFFSAWSASSAEPNAQLRKQVLGAFPGLVNVLPPSLEPGAIAFQPSAGSTHNDFVTRAWIANPLKAALGRVSEFRRAGSLPVAAPAAGARPGKAAPGGETKVPWYGILNPTAPRPLDQQLAPPLELRQDH